MRRQQRGLAHKTVRVAQTCMVEEASRKLRAHAQCMLVAQFGFTHLCRCEIESIMPREVARQRQAFRQRNHAARRLKAAPIDAGGAIEAIDIRKVAERLIDLPEQHGRACSRAAVPGPFTVDDHDLVAVLRQVLRHGRARNPRTDNEDIAPQVSAQSLTPQPLQSDKPWRPATTQVALFGRALVQHLHRKYLLLRWG